MRRQLIGSAVAALLAATPAVHAMKPDFSAVQSHDAAKALAVEGKLVAILLFPAELGGQDVEANRVYVTPEAAQARASAVASLIRMVQQGAVDKMNVIPIYKGKSFIPATIEMKASNSKTGGHFDQQIVVW